jgi:hypothetical protein
VTEEELLDAVYGAVFRLGLVLFHPPDMRLASELSKGFPDLVVAGQGGVLFRELKTQIGRLSPEQIRWQERLFAAGADVAVWRPEHWKSGEIERQLARLIPVEV